MYYYNINIFNHHHCKYYKNQKRTGKKREKRKQPKHIYISNNILSTIHTYIHTITTMLQYII